MGLRAFLLRTVLASTTFTISVWPVVPGFKLSTFTNTGFRSPGLVVAAAAPSCCVVAGADLVAIGGDRNEERGREIVEKWSSVWGFRIWFWAGG